MGVNQAHIDKLRDEGYFLLEGVISGQDLAGLRAECQTSLELQRADMERVGAETLGLSHKDKRYSLPCWHDRSPALASFLFGDMALDIVAAALGSEAYLFLELFVVKWPKTGIPFAWHQDSGYLLGHPHRPYVSLWCTLDDMSEANGTLHLLPFSRAGTRQVVEHTKEKGTNDLVGYRGDDPGVAIRAPQGSILVMSSTLLHRSGANVTSQPRRAFLASYSPEPIRARNGQLWNLAVPCIQGGQRVAAVNFQTGAGSRT